MAATKTTNYSLVKPDYNEFADISVINANMDIVDAQMKLLDDRKLTEAANNIVNKSLGTINASGLTNTFVANIDGVFVDALTSGQEIELSSAIGYIGDSATVSGQFNTIVYAGEITMTVNISKVYGGLVQGQDIYILGYLDGTFYTSGKLTTSLDYVSEYDVGYGFTSYKRVGKLLKSTFSGSTYTLIILLDGDNNVHSYDKNNILAMINNEILPGYIQKLNNTNSRTAEIPLQANYIYNYSLPLTSLDFRRDANGKLYTPADGTTCEVNFISGNPATTFNASAYSNIVQNALEVMYPIIYTGSDCIGGLFYPKALTKYNMNFYMINTILLCEIKGFNLELENDEDVSHELVEYPPQTTVSSLYPVFDIRLYSVFNITISTTSTVTLNFTGFRDDTDKEITFKINLKVTADAAIVFPSNVKFAYGVVPTFTAGSSGRVYELIFTTNDGGSTIRATAGDWWPV
ncbi:MAG: hypothetical protein N2171_04925 [Clostridia bacterium]|nr:hypothetical protein [Clostridia bacterium]